MSRRRGLTLGKFSPLHEGHALLLRAAAAHCDQLTVLVGTTDNDRYSFEQRRQWISDLLTSALVPSSLDLVIVPDPDPDVDVQKDEYGTVVDESYWSQWLTQNSQHLKGVDLVFTSDRYGAEIARRIDAVWFPIDPDRETVPVAASDINARPHELFGLVSDVAKPDVALTIAVVGAESTGKSTLVKRLAEHFETTYAHEWGRTISEAHPTLTVEDFDAIVSMQDELIRTAQRLSNGLCFADTEAITTALFAPTYLGQEHPLSWQRAHTQDFTHYLLLDPDVPWVDDGTRILDTDARMVFHNALLSSLERLDKPFTVISGDSFAAREAQAITFVERLRR